jgi:CRP-like cAMP-binding protein
MSDVPARERLAALKRVDLLARLNEAEMWELVRAGRWSRVPEGTAIVREGEGGRSLFFLGSGSAKVTKGGKLLGTLDAGACFGEMAYIKDGEMPRQATIETMSDAIVAEFDSQLLSETSINCRLQLTTALLHMMVDRLAIMNERLLKATAQK